MGDRNDPVGRLLLGALWLLIALWASALYTDAFVTDPGLEHYLFHWLFFTMFVIPVIGTIAFVLGTALVRLIKALEEVGDVP